MNKLLNKYHITLRRTGNKYLEYTRIKKELFDKFGDIDPKEYNEIIRLVTTELGI